MARQKIDTNLKTLARLYGVDTSYVDVWGTPREVSAETVLRTLQLLGATLDDFSDVPEAIRQRRLATWQAPLEPVCVAWEGTAATVPVRSPAAWSTRNYTWRLDFEDGGRVEASGRLADLPVRETHQVEGTDYTVRLLSLPEDMPTGYHELHVDLSGHEAECLVIAAPQRAYTESPAQQNLLWGVFIPLYALYRKSGWGAGDFSDLEALMQWMSDRGGSLVATLPLLATLWELTDDPSPYNPASRFFWNEFYLDPRQIPEFTSTPQAQALAQTAGAASGESSRLIDYKAQARFKRQVLEAVCETFFLGTSPRRDALVQACRENPDLELFARFRAAGERQGRPWTEWPEPLRRGQLTPGDYDESVYRYHLFAQWQVGQQLAAITDRAAAMDQLWYLDFPLGVSDIGYDAWREQNLFVRQAAGGAPPDAFFTKGQNWGFPPLSPEVLRRQRYGYFIKALRSHLRYARVLRFDHVMGLYRLYWIPRGFAADDGAYVRYPMEEMLAILALESHRYRARIVGENLGTVPAEVDEALDRHAIDELYVLQYETNPDKGPSLRPVPASAVASVNTHDMPQFAAYWQGLDIDDRVDLGMFTDEEADAERRRRADLRRELLAFLQSEGLLDVSGDVDAVDVLEACQAYLARSPARVVLVNLEDLWAETEPQNVPGTYRERPNWRRKARYSLDEFQDLPVVQRVLGTVHRLRRQAEDASRDSKEQE